MFDSLERYLRKLCGHDNFVMGVTSKQKGQVVCAGAIIDVWMMSTYSGKLFYEAAVKAAIDFVQVCEKHATLLSGRRSLAEIISAVNASKILIQICFF